MPLLAEDHEVWLRGGLGRQDALRLWEALQCSMTARGFPRRLPDALHMREVLLTAVRMLRSWASGEQSDCCQCVVRGLPAGDCC